MINIKIVKYAKDVDYDEYLVKIIDIIKKDRTEKDNDFLLMLVGAKGIGKSRLMLHIMDLFLGEKASVSFLGLNRGDFARALKVAGYSEKPRFCGNDEANINKREGMTKYVRSVIDLYYSIRGKNIFHVWANPSLDAIDKAFVKETVNGVIFVFNRFKNRPRLYYYFRKKELLDFFDKYETFELRMLKKHAKEYALYRGWFKDYHGKLLTDYLAKKEKRMDEKIDEFYEQWAKGKEDDFEVVEDISQIHQSYVYNKNEKRRPNIQIIE